MGACGPTLVPAHAAATDQQERHANDIALQVGVVVPGPEDVEHVQEADPLVRGRQGVAGPNASTTRVTGSSPRRTRPRSSRTGRRPRCEAHHEHPLVADDHPPGSRVAQHPLLIWPSATPLLLAASMRLLRGSDPGRRGHHYGRVGSSVLGFRRWVRAAGRRGPWVDLAHTTAGGGDRDGLRCRSADQCRCLRAGRSVLRRLWRAAGGGRPDGRFTHVLRG